MSDASFTPLTARLVRRARLPAWLAEPPVECDAAQPGADWRDDLRLFAIAWAAGFVFFLTFLA